YSYLQVILLGLRGMRVEERAREILQALGGLGGELDRFRTEFQILGRHIGDAGKKYEEGTRRLAKLQDSVDRLHALGGESAEIEEGGEAGVSEENAGRPLPSLFPNG